MRHLALSGLDVARHSAEVRHVDLTGPWGTSGRKVPLSRPDARNRPHLGIDPNGSVPSTDLLQAIVPTRDLAVLSIQGVVDRMTDSPWPGPQRRATPAGDHSRVQDRPLRNIGTGSGGKDPSKTRGGPAPAHGGEGARQPAVASRQPCNDPPGATSAAGEAGLLGACNGRAGHAARRYRTVRATPVRLTRSTSTLPRWRSV